LKLRKRDLKGNKKNEMLIKKWKEALARIVDFLEYNRHELVTIREINDKLFDDFYPEDDLKLKPLENAFCDGFLLPITRLTQTVDQTK
jgi:hypothetical protein